MSEEFEENLHGAPHHVRPQSRGGTGEFEDLFHWPGVAHNQISKKHTAFHNLYHNATLLEVVQRLPTFEGPDRILNVDFLTASREKNPALKSWKTLHGSDVTPWESLEYLIKLLGVERFGRHINDQLCGRSVEEFLAREAEYIRFFLQPLPHGYKDAPRTTEEWSSLYMSWRRIIGPTTFFQGVLVLSALERGDKSLHMEFLTKTKRSGRPEADKNQTMLIAWKNLFGSKDTTPWDAAAKLKVIFGSQRIAKNIRWQMRGRSIPAFINRQQEYFGRIFDETERG